MPTPTADELKATIAENIGKPLKVEGDEGSVEMHGLDKQVQAAKFVSSGQAATTSTTLGAIFRQISPPSALGT